MANFIPPCEWGKSGYIFLCNWGQSLSQTDRQTDKFFDAIYGGMWIFSFSKICYLPTHFARRGIIKKVNI